MRLIDADELLDGYKHMGYDPTEHPEDRYMEGWCNGFNAAVDHCMHHVIHAPTITPERKRGRWIPHEDEDGEHYGDKCSVCGEWYVMPYGKTKFCPDCGADMRGEQDERY